MSCEVGVFPAFGSTIFSLPGFVCRLLISWLHCSCSNSRHHTWIPFKPGTTVLLIPQGSLAKECVRYFLLHFTCDYCRSKGTWENSCCFQLVLSESLLASFCLNLTQPPVTWEEGISSEELPLPNWPVCERLAGFLVDVESPAHCGRSHL